MELFRRVKNLFTSQTVEPEVLEMYRHRIPTRIFVQVRFDDHAKQWVAEIELPNTEDHLFTESENQDALTHMVNDAVMTYYDVPSAYAAQLAHFQNPALDQQAKRQWKLA